MIAAWILYCTGIGLLFACAAHFADGLIGRAGGQTRRVWAAGLIGATVLPVLAVVLRDAPPGVEVEGVLVPTTATSGLVMDFVVSLATLDALLGISWILLSSALGLRFLGGWLLTHRSRRAWRPATVDGVPVLVSDRVGPATVGFVRSRIVLPRWALAAAPAERSMIVRHEQEHVASGDPRLVALAALVGVAMPWNPATWYMARRLRLAVEVDCDRRVMRSGDLDVRSYAELLLAVGARRASPAYGIGFSVGRPFLEQRIDRMTSARGGASRAQAAIAVGVIAIALASAWGMPQPIRAADVSSEVVICPDTGTTDLNRALLEGAARST
jgi:hypothetical protein